MSSVLNDTTGVLTREHVKAIQAAKSLGFRHSEGVSTIETPSHGDNRTIIQVDCRFAQYGDDPIDDPRKHAQCWHYAHFVNDHNVIGSFTRSLKAGDLITLVWVRDNNNEHVEKVGLHVDELHAIVERAERSGRIRRVNWLLAVAICRDDTARLFQAK